MIHFKSTFTTLRDALWSSDPKALAVIALLYTVEGVSSFEKPEEHHQAQIVKCTPARKCTN
jgi:hypothetical protein